MQKWNICSLLVILMVSMQNKAGSQTLQLLKKTSFPFYSSASSLQYYNNKLYVIGDDAPQMLILNRQHQMKDSLRLFKDVTQRIPKETKVDLEASFILQKDGETFLFAVASFSDKPRNKLFRMPLQNLQKGFETFSTSINSNTKGDINIEGATAVGNKIVLSNRANGTQKNNQLLVLKADVEKGFEPAVTHTILLQLPQSKNIIGVSGLDYIEAKDLLLFTASTELTDNAIDDGEIGTSYLGYIHNFKTQLANNIIVVDTLQDLTPVLQQARAQKIESATVEKVKRKKLILHLAADNDDGSSHLYKVRLKLPAKL